MSIETTLKHSVIQLRARSVTGDGVKAVAMLQILVNARVSMIQNYYERSYYSRISSLDGMRMRIIPLPTAPYVATPPHI